MPSNVISSEPETQTRASARRSERMRCVGLVLARIGDARTSPRDEYSRADVVNLLENIATVMEHSELGSIE